MELTKDEKSALVGMILGDGYLQKTGKKNSRLRLEHSLKQRAYLEWKVRLLPRLFQGKLTVLTRIHPKTHKAYHYVRHQSNSSPVLGKFRQIFYIDGKKQIPNNLEKLLMSSLALVIWYLDDGYYYARDNCMYLYLGRVSRAEAEIAKIALSKRFNLVSRLLDKKEKGFALYFSREEVKKFTQLIKKFVPPEMGYKIPS